MRADRLLSILLLLQVHRRMTARELAKRLEVSERTIHRDMEALGAAGVPVVAERGTGGGWRLMEPYSTNLTGLSEAEIQALFVTGPARLLADLGLRQASEAALIKLLAALPSLARSNASSVRNRIHIDARSWSSQEEAIPYLPTLQNAIWQERRVQLAYRRSDDTCVERLVDPLGLVAKGSVWYFVAAVEGEPRTYRVSRVQDARITDEPFIRPADFDLAAYWEQSSSDFKANLPRYPATLRVDPAILAYMRTAGRYARITSTEPPEADGWVRVAMLFEGEHNACEYVLSFGAQVIVVEPQELREKVIEVAKSIVALYQSQDSVPGRTNDHPGVARDMLY
ncbi:MAG TPA: YafY family protein [Ktedonobacteraceae bacterium]|jgi:predicted DNA-binding transcriptional regulator YafY|nr:YafY family protein [Ktedonobacteraceae bacterium]